MLAKSFRSCLWVEILLVGLSFSARTLAQCGPIDGDSDKNQLVDLRDHSDFANCQMGPGHAPDPEPPQTSESCLANLDLDGDSDIDLFDFAEFQTNFTGPFRPECFNKVFVSSVTFSPTMGSVPAYDNECNILATGAGLNNPAGNAFVAWVSSPNSLARNRLGTARGFVRPDGVPVADSLDSLLNQNVIFNPIRIDEFGNDVGARSVLTGTQANGSLGPSNCFNWTSSSGIFTAGQATDGPGFWTQGGQGSCNGSYSIYCFEKTHTRVLNPPRHAGKVVYLSTSNFTPGAGQGLAAADQLCASEKPAGIANVRAMLATSTASAASRFLSNAFYVRVDGQLVGTGQDLASLSNLHSGIWQTGSGSYVIVGVWTGSSGFTFVGTAASTCSNWTSALSEAGIGGLAVTTLSPGWWYFTSRPCTTPQRIYCAEH